jgi:signal transduction histidine kinase
MSSREEMARAQNALATSLFRSGNAEEAEVAFRDAIALAPNMAELHHNLGVLLSRTRLAEALVSLDRALAIEPERTDSLQARAEIRIQRGDYAEALEDYHRLHRLWAAEGVAAPAAVALHLNVGTIYEQVGDRESARSHYRDAIALDPKAIEPALRLATLFASERPRKPDHREEAIRLLVTVLERGDGEPELIARACFLLGSLYDDTPERYPEAFAAYQRGLAVQPEHASAHNNLGALYMRQGDVVRAREHLERALALDPGSRNVHRNLARLVYHQMTIEEGEKLFTRARQGLFGVAQALVDLASVEAYEDFYSRGHQVKNRVGLAASRLKQLARQARDPDGPPREQLAERLEDLLADHEDLYRMLADIIRVVKPESMQPVLVDTAAAMKRLTRRLQTAYRGRTRIKLRVEGRVPRLKLDPARVTEAIENVVANAVDAISERHGEDAGRKGQITLTVQLEAPRREVVLRIEDNGPGIQPLSIQEVLRAGFTTKPAGSGLGLAITRRIVADHGGTLEVEGRPGEGARITLRLPVDAEAKTTPLGLSSRPVILSDPESLLVDELA